MKIVNFAAVFACVICVSPVFSQQNQPTPDGSQFVAPPQNLVPPTPNAGGFGGEFQGLPPLDSGFRQNQPQTSRQFGGSPTQLEDTQAGNVFGNTGRYPENDQGFNGPDASRNPVPSAMELLAASGRFGGRRQFERKLVTPNELGHFIWGGTSVSNGTDTAVLPLAAGLGRVAVADTNRALPQNRVFLDYRRYTNAFQSIESFEGIAPDVDSFIFGFEKILDEDERFSVEVRMPFASSALVNEVDINASSGKVGNITVIGKGLVGGHRPGRHAIHQIGRDGG